MPTQNVTRGQGLLENLLARQRAKMADRLIPPVLRKGRLLDIGSGATPLFVLTTEFSEKVGLDKVVRSECCILDSNIKLVHCELEQENPLPFEDEYFDVVTMLAVLEHIEPRQLARLLGEIHRIIKPGGMFIITTPAIWTDRLLRLMAKYGLVSPIEIEEHKEAYSHAKILTLLRAASFSEDKLRFGYFEMFMNIWATALK